MNTPDATNRFPTKPEPSTEEVTRQAASGHNNNNAYHYLRQAHKKLSALFSFSSSALRASLAFAIVAEGPGLWTGLAKNLSNFFSSAFSKATSPVSALNAPSALDAPVEYFTQKGLAFEEFEISEKTAAELRTAIKDLGMWESKLDTLLPMDPAMAGPSTEDFYKGKIQSLKEQFGLMAHPNTGEYLASQEALLKEFGLCSSSERTCTIQTHRPMTPEEYAPIAPEKNGIWALSPRPIGPRPMERHLT